DFGVFQLSARARVLCSKNGVVLHKTYLAICPMQINSFRRTILYSPEMDVFKAMKYRLIAYCKVTISCTQSY
ncbi:hypothetical protein EII14_09015, partial [Alloprevotella sp. OH1205_COT-284]